MRVEEETKEKARAATAAANHARNVKSRLAGYLEDPAESQEMEEEKEAGEGGAFLARGDRCCRVITPDHMGLGRQRPSFVVRAGEREREPNLLRPPHTNISFTRRIEAKQ